ncbi:MAG: transposase [Solirubrobacterales bacterium]
MPRRNVSDRVQTGPHHVYNRARCGRAVFRDDADRELFIELLESRLGRAKFRSRRFRHAAAVLDAEVCAMCLMTTHFHLIIWQHESEALRRLMQSVMIAYVRSYNRKYGTSGALFAGPFRARQLIGRKDLRWTTAYVHANHPEGPNYRFSTHRAYLDDLDRPGWLNTTLALDAFGGRTAYATFMRDHATRAELNARFF